MSAPKSSKLLDILLSSPSGQITKLPPSDIGTSDVEPYPFLAIVGQYEMKLALMLSLINPLVGGVLLIGPRGTAKTTAVRSLTDLLPTVKRSLCPHGCTEADIELYGMDGVCKECATKFGHGDPLTIADKVRIFELPLNSRLEDVVGGINERVALEQRKMRLERGILGHADGHIIYIDEVNLLEDPITDALLDAAAQGHYTVRRGPLKMTYNARIMLIGSMNPEEGRLRPQMMDRFGLRAVVSGLDGAAERFQVYERAMAYKQHPEHFAMSYAAGTLALADEIQQARDRLPQVTISDEAQALGLQLIRHLEIDSNRAEITLFEAARAHATADERTAVTVEDIQAVAMLALRQRQSPALQSFFQEQADEDGVITAVFQNNSKPKKRRSTKKKSAKSETA